MRDIPVFATQYGVASLVLKEIPHWKKAYITMQSVSQTDLFIKECKEFCLAAGAEEIYACGHPCLEIFPMHTSVFRLSADKHSLPDTDAAIFPVQRETLEQWRSIYNQKMQDVPNAAYMTTQDGLKMLEEHDGYFIHTNGELLGIGRASDNRISVIAAVQPGAGKQIVSALAHGIFADVVTLQVASSNEKAMRLYTQLGFVPVEEISRWYKII